MGSAFQASSPLPCLLLATVVNVEGLVEELTAKKAEITTLEEKITTQRSHEFALERRLKRSREDNVKLDEENSSLRRENAEVCRDGFVFNWWERYFVVMKWQGIIVLFTRDFFSETSRGM